MIQIQNLHFAYGKTPVLEGVDMQLVPGHVYGLLGGNGQGKSTLFRLICGLLFPKSGNINIQSLLPYQRSPQFLQQVMLLPEEISAPELKPKEYAKWYGKFYPNFDLSQFEALLIELEVPVNNIMGNMSYGQKKKALLAFALACNTPVLLLDEPTNGLDIISKGKFRKVIATYMNENKIIVISTHQVRDLEQLIDYILVLNNQKIIFNKSMEDIGRFLNFTIVNQGGIRDCIYEEAGLKGVQVVMKGDGMNSSKVDLELLYKALQFNSSALFPCFPNNNTNKVS